MNELKFKNMCLKKLSETVAELSNDDLVDLWNSYCSFYNCQDDCLYYLESIDDVLKYTAPSEVIRYTKDINLNHMNLQNAVFQIDAYGYYKSYSSAMGFFEINPASFEEMVEAMLELNCLFLFESASSNKSTLVKLFNILNSYNNFLLSKRNKNIIFEVE